MFCKCGSRLVIKQEDLIKFYQCPSCTRVLRKDTLLNTPEEIKKAKVKHGIRNKLGVGI